MSHQQSLAQTQFPKRRTIPPLPGYGGAQRRTRAGALQRSGPKQPGRSLVVPCGRWTPNWAIAPRSSCCGPILGATAGSSRSGRNCSLPWTQSCDIPNVARVRGSRGLYRTQELHHFISLAVCRHRHRDHRRSGPWGCVAPCLEGRRGSLLQGAGAPSRRWGMPTEAREFSTEY